MPGERLGSVETDVVIIDHIDSNNHLNNAAWGLHLETGQLEAASEFGIAMQMPLRRIRIKYKMQLLKGTRVKILTYLTKGEDFIEFDQELIREDNVAGTGLSNYGYTLLDMGKPLQRTISTVAVKLQEVFPSKGTTLHPLTAVRYFEQVRAEIMSARGIDMDREREERGIRFMVASLEAKYAQAMYPGQNVIIRTGFDTYFPQLMFHQEMVHDGQVVVKADTNCVVVDQSDNLIRSLGILNPIKDRLSVPITEV